MAAEGVVESPQADEGSEQAVQGPGPKDTVERWLRELDAADRHEREWRERAEKIVNLYKDERKKGEAVDSTARRFNILYANTEVLKGALYQRQPVPDIRRRWLDKDPVGRLAALILTRAVASTLDHADFDGVMRACVQDMVLPGRGMARVTYKPTLSQYEGRVPVDQPGEGAVLPEDVQQDEQGYFRMEPVEEVTFECVEIDYVEWPMVRLSPAKRWKRLRWIAFGELLTRDDLVAQFGEEIGGQVSLKWMPKGMEDTEENAIFKRALVWTVWNKTQKKVIVVTDGYKEGPLKETDDPLLLEQFFPTPAPLYSIFTNDSMVPTPEYAVYQDHALDLDALEERISVLQEALRRRGVYDASVPELETLAKTGDNKFVPIKEWRAFSEKGGLAAAMEEQDLTNLATVLAELMKIAEQKKQQIYEIIGVSDIMRGATKATETLGAQELKANFGSMRTQTRQAEVQRFARDVIRIVAEIIAEHFSAKTLQEMSNIELAVNAAELQLLQQTAPQDPRCQRPTWEDVLAVLRSDKLRSFKIDIETDSTIKPQADQEQKNRIELITSVTGYLEKALPAVAQGLMPKKLASEILMFGVRAFPAGAQMEEILDEWASGGVDEMLAPKQPQEQQQPTPEQQAAAADEQRKGELHGLTKQQMTADLVKKRADAYAALVDAEHKQPGAQLDLTTKLAKLAGILDPQADPAGTATTEGAPAGATLQ